MSLEGEFISPWAYTWESDTVRCDGRTDWSSGIASIDALLAVNFHLDEVNGRSEIVNQPPWSDGVLGTVSVAKCETMVRPEQSPLDNVLARRQASCGGEVAPIGGSAGDADGGSYSWRWQRPDWSR